MSSASKSVDNLLEAVKELSADELAEFTARLAQWQSSAGEAAPSDSFLIREAKVRLPATEAKRLRMLVAKSEQGELGPDEVEEYRQLAQRAERLNAVRMQALAELARRRDQPIGQVIKEVGIPGEPHGA